jgi:diguanylate cyclase (GGDEF)-like protein
MAVGFTAPAHAQQAAHRLTPITLQLNWKHQFQFAGYYAAIEKGYYHDAGFEVTLREFQNGVDPVDAVLKGDADYGVGASELALRYAKGAPIVAVAAILQHSPLVLLARGSEVQTVQDLAGKRIELAPHEAELYAYLRREGLERKRFIEQPATFSIQNLLDGKTDAISGYSTDEPFALQQAHFRYSIFSPRASGIDFYGDTLFTSATLARANPQQVEAFRAASLRGWQYALDHPEEIADLILGKYGQRHSREHLLFEAAELRRLMQPQLIELGHLNPGRWQHIAAVYAEAGLLPEEYELHGFIFNPNVHADLTWAYRGLMAALLLTLFLGAMALRESHNNRRLRIEIAKREAIETQLRETNERLGLQLDEVRVLQSRLEEQAVRDSLTGLYNRRYLDDALPRELQRAQREKYPVAIVLADIDRFKRVNDTYGHQSGDIVLQALANLLKENVRGGDLPCRWGGEEFVLVLPRMSLEHALARADALRKSFSALKLELEGRSVSLTLSAGVAVYPGHGAAVADLLHAADEALYEAKNGGRDQVRVAKQDGGGGQGERKRA